MKYSDGTDVRLGDFVKVPVPSGEAVGRIVMLGADYSHLDIDPAFLIWVKGKKVLGENDVVLEWTGKNPLAHEDPNLAPVGNFYFNPLDQFVVFIKRG